MSEESNSVAAQERALERITEGNSMTKVMNGETERRQTGREVGQLDPSYAQKFRDISPGTISRQGYPLVPEHDHTPTKRITICQSGAVFRE